MALDHRCDKAEAQARPLHCPFGTAVITDKRIEQAINQIDGNALPFINNFHRDMLMSVEADGPDCNLDLAAIGTIFDCIVDQIDERAVQA